jgi:DNA-binding transcriptional LysR family regulator
MEFHQLTAVVAVAEAGTFTAAADALGLSQPSVSQAVRILERELGTPLFDRDAAGARLTEAGRALLGPARQALHDRGLARAAVEEVAGLVAGTIELGCIPTVAADLVTPVVGAMRRRHPGVTLHISEPGEDESVAAYVRSGQWEVGFGVVPVADRRLVSVVLGEQDLVAVLSRGHAATHAPDGAIAVTALADLPLVTAPAQTASYLQLEAALAERGRVLRSAVETVHRDTIVALVHAGAGAAVVPRGVAEADRRSGVVVAELDPPIRRSVGLVHRDAVLSPAARAVVDLAVERARRRDGNGA